jgi:type I restriction enzyme S subunit
MNLLCLRVNSTHNPIFIYYVLTSNEYKQHFEAICNKAVNQASINQSNLKKTKLVSPSKKEQQKIADFLTSLDEKLNLEKNRLEQVKLFKKSLLQRMFV